MRAAPGGIDALIAARTSVSWVLTSRFTVSAAVHCLPSAQVVGADAYSPPIGVKDEDDAVNVAPSITDKPPPPPDALVQIAPVVSIAPKARLPATRAAAVPQVVTT